MLIRILLLLTTVAISMLAAGAVLANEHLPCADKDREIPGNRTSPCKAHLSEVSLVEHTIIYDYPNCNEALIWHLPGFTLPDPPKNIEWLYIQHRNQYNYQLGNEARDPIYGIPWGYRGAAIRPGVITFWFQQWTLKTPVTHGSYIPQSTVEYPSTRLHIEIYDGRYPKYALFTDYVSLPASTNVTIETVQSCLSLVAQEKANREHAAEVERREQAEAARLEAERDAAAKEEEQARLEAKSQARIAKRQLAAANERRLTIAKAEEIKTQTLIDEIVTQEVLTEILNDIVRIRLAGQEDRARITNEYLDRARTASANFEVETSGIESRIQEYLDFNALLLAEISEYQLSIRNRLESLRLSLSEQQDEINRLEAEAQDIAAPPEDSDNIDGALNPDSGG